MKISILDCGIGNLNAIKNALKFIKIDCQLIKTKSQIKNSHSLILPGVGSFFHAMKSIKKKGMYDAIIDHIFVNEKPVLGICLGMQLLFSDSNEIEKQSGLNYIQGNIDKINFNNKKNTFDLNVGWQNVEIKKKNFLFKGVPNNESFYFLHSYTAYNLNNRNIIANYRNNNRKIVAAINKKNAYGVQFHPEKSGKYGLKILKNFSKI